MGMFVVAPYHHHHHHSSPAGINLANSDPIHSPSSATALGVGMGVNVIPLLSAAPCLPPEDTGDCYPNTGRGGKVSSGIQFWQNQQQFSNNNHNNNSMKKNNNNNNASASNLDHHNNNNSAAGIQFQSGGGSGGGVGMMMSSSSSTMATCQDCGNQAKKDCPHRRCRTCCKSRGFDCATHVKSTWVPAARRRERQQLSTTGGGGGGGGGGSTTSASTSGAKKPRLVVAASQTTTTSHTSTSNTTPSRSFDTTSSHHQDAGVIREAMPGQVRAPAVFRCVRVTTVEDGDDEYAYQAVVKIGGHLFKGVLYDQGPEATNTRDGSFPNLSELHLGGGRGGGGGSSSSPIMDPSDVYGGGGLRGGGSTYGNPMN